MAISIKPASGNPRFGPLRGQKARTVVITGDASKPAGGYTILASALGFSFIDFGVCGDIANGALGCKAIIGTAQTDLTLQYYYNSGTTASIGVGLAASDTSITTNPVALYVIGR
jgi:hypothetical protein